MHARILPLPLSLPLFRLPSVPPFILFLYSTLTQSQFLTPCPQLPPQSPNPDPDPLIILLRSSSVFLLSYLLSYNIYLFYMTCRNVIGFCIVLENLKSLCNTTHHMHACPHKPAARPPVRTRTGARTLTRTPGPPTCTRTGTNSHNLPALGTRMPAL